MMSLSSELRVCPNRPDRDSGADILAMAYVAEVLQATPPKVLTLQQSKSLSLEYHSNSV